MERFLLLMADTPREFAELLDVLLHTNILPGVEHRIDFPGLYEDDDLELT